MLLIFFLTKTTAEMCRQSVCSAPFLPQSCPGNVQDMSSLEQVVLDVSETIWPQKEGFCYSIYTGIIDTLCWILKFSSLLVEEKPTQKSTQEKNWLQKCSLGKSTLQLGEICRIICITFHANSSFKTLEADTKVHWNGLG